MGEDLPSPAQRSVPRAWHVAGTQQTLGEEGIGAGEWRTLQYEKWRLLGRGECRRRADYNVVLYVRVRAERNASPPFLRDGLLRARTSGSPPSLRPVRGSHLPSRHGHTPGPASPARCVHTPRTLRPATASSGCPGSQPGSSGRERKNHRSPSSVRTRSRKQETSRTMSTRALPRAIRRVFNEGR